MFCAVDTLHLAIGTMRCKVFAKLHLRIVTDCLISTSLQYANHFYPDADSLQPTRIVCAVGSTVCGECTHWVALSAPHLPGLIAA